MGERGGSIVNVTSIEAHRAGPGFAVYSAMKAAVENLTKSLALELAERRIRVNCIAPDMIPTPGDAGLSIEAAAAERDWSKTVLPDMGHADDCAAAVVYLAARLQPLRHRDHAPPRHRQPRQRRLEAPPRRHVHAVALIGLKACP